MTRNIFILALLISLIQNHAEAQAPAPSPADPQVEKQLQDLDQVTEAVAQEIAKDPNVEVQTTPDKIIFKKRTPPSVDPVDPKEHQRYENLQGVMNVFFAKGTTYVSKQTFDKYRGDQPTEEKNKSSHFMVGMGIRPPVRALKRLQVGVDIGMESGGTLNLRNDGHSLTRGHNINANFGYFGTWDVLVLNRARAIVSAGYRNAGYEIVDYGPKGESYDLHYHREHQGSVKWNQLLYTSGEGNVSLFAQYGRTSTGSSVLTFGFNIMYGPEWPWLKRQKSK